PTWSPDGSRLLFAHHEADGQHIRLYLADGDSLSNPQRLTDREPPEYNGVFAPDGRREVLFVAITQVGTQGNLDIARIAGDGSGSIETVVGDVSGTLSHQDWPSW